MKVVEITSMHSKRNISVINTFVFTDKYVLETRKRILRKMDSSTIDKKEDTKSISKV